MTESPWRVTPSEVPRLIEAILNPQRLHSLTLVSPSSDTGRPRLDVESLLEQTADLPTDVVLLDSMLTSERLSDSISSAFHCYGGSVRVVMPDARVTDHYRRHPLLLIYPDDDPGISLRRVVEAVERTPLVRHEPAVRPEPGSGAAAPAAPAPGRPGAAPQAGGVARPGAAPRPGPPMQGPGGAPRPGPPRPGTGQVPASAGTPGPAPASAPAPRPGPFRPASTPVPRVESQPAADAVAPEASTAREPAAAPLHTTFGLADIEAVVGRAVGRVLEEQFGGPSAATEREQSRADTAEELLSEAEKRIRRLETELQERRESEALPRVFADEERQLHWELEWLWLTGTPEPDRQKPLPAWTIGPDCIAGMATPLVPRRKTLLIMLAILQQKHWDIFETHQFLEGRGGRPRMSSEGTTIWRTYVKEKTPQAPRLTWWSTRDGGYHFEHVGAHDALL